jgi:hypothetical protein
VRSFELAENEFTEFLQICVTDAGIGISEENISKLFQAFSQINSSLGRKFEGTGLGLAMVKQVTELLGGTVAVASREGEGAVLRSLDPTPSVHLALHRPQGRPGGESGNSREPTIASHSWSRMTTPPRSWCAFFSRPRALTSCAPPALRKRSQLEAFRRVSQRSYCGTAQARAGVS